MLKTYTLNDGFAIPKVGLGTYSMKGLGGVRQIEQAINLGYRLIDSAYNYENEGTVGRAVRNSGVPRDQITVTSKLPGRYHAFDDALVAIQESVARTGLNYIDLYLIHWPNPIEDKYVEAWKALITAQQTGLVRSIGVSNFLPEHIERLEKETGVLPVVNQVETHPYFNQAEQLEFDFSKGIVTQAWSPVGRRTDIIDDPVITGLGEKYLRTNHQIVLRWHTQRGLLPIPKSSHFDRQRANLEIFDFELTLEEIEKINGLSRTDGRMADQDPKYYQEF